MNILAFAFGLALGIMHWFFFVISIKKLFAKKEKCIGRGISALVALSRLAVTIGLGTGAILCLGLPALGVAVGLLVGFNACRIPFLVKSSRAPQRLEPAEQVGQET